KHAKRHVVALIDPIQRKQKWQSTIELHLHAISNTNKRAWKYNGLFSTTKYDPIDSQSLAERNWVPENQVRELSNHIGNSRIHHIAVSFTDPWKTRNDPFFVDLGGQEQ